MPSVAVLVGSLRRESVNLKLAKALAKIAAPKLDFRMIEIGDLPLYNDDLWAAPPRSVIRLKEEVAACDAILMLTPEYNRGVSSVLKNAFDWGTRPYGQNVWDGKPGAVGGASSGAVGAAVAQGQLRNSLVVLGVILMGQPELYLQHKAGMFDDADGVSDPALLTFLSTWVDRFADWIARVRPR